MIFLLFQIIRLDAPQVKFPLKNILLPFLLTLLLVPQHNAFAFCGFYVGSAGSELYNDASQVIYVRDNNRIVLTMQNDFRGNVNDFAMVVPVPSVLKRDQIHVGDNALFQRIDDFTAPRLVEYFDPDPCRPPIAYAVRKSVQEEGSKEMNKALGVTVKAQYVVGEYDISVLSAKESGGLLQWLGENGFQVSSSTEKALTPYIRQGLYFFVAKVNLKEFDRANFQYLSPLQLAFESERFILPIRLGMANAVGDQDLIIYALTKNGRVEATNYRTAKIPSNQEVPLFVKDEFPSFYKALFQEAVTHESGPTVFTEFFWDMNWCDPCSAEPLTREELKKLGVFWVDDYEGRAENGLGQVPNIPLKVTRLHVRYNEQEWPEDLLFQETKDTRNFQGRYVIRRAFDPDKDSPTADAACLEKRKHYNAQLAERQEKQAETLSELTGWNIRDVRAKMNMASRGSGDGRSWWRGLW